VPQGQELAELEAVSEHLKQVTDHIRDVFWLIDPAEGRILYVSPAFQSVWGRPTESAYDNPRIMLEAVHEEDRQRVEAALPYRESGNYDIEYRVVHPGGGIRWVRDRAFPVTDEGGRVSRIAGIAQDITPAKVAEAKMQARERFHHTLFEHTNDLITLIDSQGRWVFHSHSVERLLGYAENELNARSVLDLIHPADLATVTQMIKDLTDEAESSRLVEYRLRRSDGT
jgi:PAS domain S-box-containing protein